MNIKRGLATLAIAALSLTSLAACGSDTAQDEEKPDSLSFWYYEEDDAGQTQAWRRAAKAFEKETGVKINFERKSFTQIVTVVWPLNRVGGEFLPQINEGVRHTSRDR